ncbi:hypothetical protein D4R47_00925 [archaeon]|nr:MAG: hypothetical protein D4R47_00925 [archaeon]
MKIQKIEIMPFNIPYKRGGVTTSLGSDAAMKNVLLALYSDDSLVGWGETAPLPTYAGESQESVVEVLKNYLAPYLINRDPRRINACIQEMDRLISGQSFAKSAVDFALHDLLARYLEVPLYQLFGGKCRESYPLAWTLGWKSIDETVNEAGKAVENGYKALKIKIGNPDWQSDVKRVRCVREAVGDGYPIRVDANQGYSIREAIRVIRLMEPFDLQLVEQPIVGWDLTGMNYVRRRIPFPVMADESACSPHDIVQIIRHEAADIVNIKPQKIGGFVKTKQFASTATAANLELFSSSRMCSSIGVAAMSHFYAALANAGFEGEFVDGILFAEDDLVVDPVHVSNGFVSIPDTVGGGVEISEKKLKRYVQDVITIQG